MIKPTMVAVAACLARSPAAICAPVKPGWHFLDLYPSIYEGGREDAINHDAGRRFLPTPLDENLHLQTFRRESRDSVAALTWHGSRSCRSADPHELHDKWPAE